MQLDLPLAPRRPARRERPVIERLRDVLRRRGINPTWKTDHNFRMWILPYVGFDAGELLRTEPRGEHTGLPVQGCWETLCAWHVNAAQHCPEERYGYQDPEMVAHRALPMIERRRMG